MLKLKYRCTNYDLAKRALANWEYDSNTLDDMLRKSHVTANAIYAFTQNGKVNYLRLAPIEEKSMTNVQGELEFILYLVQNKFPALDPVRMKNGKILTLVDTEWGKYFAAAFRGVPGVPITATDYSADVMYQYGKTLGRLHHLSANFKPRVKKQSYEDVFVWIEKVFQENPVTPYASKECSTLKMLFSRFPKTPENFGLVHFDYKPDNVFYDVRTRSCFVIDFDDSMYHWYALDHAQAMRSIAVIMKGNAENFEAAKGKYLRGYKSEFIYSEEIEKIFPFMLRFSNLYKYAKLVRSVSEKIPNEPNWMFTLRGEVSSAIKQLEASFERYYQK